MRITDFPMLAEIKYDYIRFRREGNSREEATQALLNAYHNEITTGAEDDGLLFWVGVADAQYSRKELSEEVAKNALEALDQIQNSVWNLCIGDLERRRKKYAQAPMPERKVGKPRPPFCCDWKFGDTYAYQLKGPYAERMNLDGTYALLRTVHNTEWIGRIVPIVTITFWGSKPFPQNSEEFASVPIAILGNTLKFYTLELLFCYSSIFYIGNKRELEAFELEYVGNFADVTMTWEEMVEAEKDAAVISIPDRFGRDIFLYWEYNDHFSPLISEEDRRKEYLFLKTE